MTHLQELLARYDYDVDRLLTLQSLNPADPRFGAFVSSQHVDSRSCVFLMAEIMTAYICRESRHYLSHEVRKSLEAGFVYLKKGLRPSGCVDLTGCNFDSAPDTAFALNELLLAWWLLEKRMCAELEWLSSPLLALMTRLAEGVAAGGFHTPNHRWVIAASLKCLAPIAGRPDFSKRADEYLFEGLDLNEDGEFAERSAGNYNQINDDQMIRLFMATDDRSYLEAARKNLTMMYAYIDPDGSVFTNNSTRQDKGVKTYPGSYYIFFLLTGWFLGDKSLAAMGEYCYRIAMYGTGNAVQPPFDRRLLSAVPWLLLIDGLEAFAQEAEPDLSPVLSYNRAFPDSGIARMREGNLSLTVMQNRPNFLYIQNGTLSMYMVIHSHVCEFVNFMPQKIESIENGYRLSSHIKGWYYLPFYPEKPATSDWWAMDNANTRERMINVPLTTVVEATMADGHVDVRVHTEGYENIPLRIEIGVLPCQVRHDSFVMEGKAGSSLLLTKGMLELTGPQGDVLTIEEGFAEHGYTYRRDHAYPLSPSHFNVFLTAYTPCDKTFRIGTKGFEKKDLLPWE